MKKLFENGQITVSENGSGEIFIRYGDTKIRVSPGAGYRLCITNHDGYLLPGELHGLPCIDAVSHEWMRDRCGGVERKRDQKLHDHWETQIGKPIEEVKVPEDDDDDFDL